MPGKEINAKSVCFPSTKQERMNITPSLHLHKKALEGPVAASKHQSPS